MTPQARYELMMSKAPDEMLTGTAARDILEALHTLQEGGGIAVSLREAGIIYRAFRLVLTGGFTQDMRM
jgi:hypothetical protein